MPMIQADRSKLPTGGGWQHSPILGIESSCDETAAAVLGGGGQVLSNVISSQISVHAKFGGVVPELAARAHVSMIDVVVNDALAHAHLSKHDLGAVAVTQGPGLAGALLVGVNYAKALSYGLGIPVIGVNHLEGHIASAWLGDPTFPLRCVVLVVSGGHTHLFRRESDGRCALLGCTRDDAAGEAFDKGAQMLGLEFPGGPAIDRLARHGNPGAIVFPRFQPRKTNLEFSFSGLKTSLLYKLRDMNSRARAEQTADLAAGYQEAIVQVLVARAFSALAQTGLSALAVVGGVSANSRLRTLLNERAGRAGVRLALPPMAFCTDNAAMIASAGRQALLTDGRSTPHLDVHPGLQIESMPTVSHSKEVAHS
jgi:N6-L-threonylcarbamoyladenine synthase